MSRTVLVVAAHSDDEALGCGGTIARHVAEGDLVHAVFLADGVSSRPDSDPSSLDHRRSAADEAHRLLGLASVRYLDFPDNRMDSVALLDIVQSLEATIHALRPDVVYTHHYGDLNVDHRVAHQAVMTACRPLPGASVKEIYAFEVLSSTEWSSPAMEAFTPTMFVDISDHLEAKLDALKAYSLEMRPAPHSRSLEHVASLARHRGHTVGCAAAEAFVTIRMIR
jgi:N-acetylglucosamine malate deacetylase 1